MANEATRDHADFKRLDGSLVRIPVSLSPLRALFVDGRTRMHGKRIDLVLCGGEGVSPRR